MQVRDHDQLVDSDGRTQQGVFAARAFKKGFFFSVFCPDKNRPGEMLEQTPILFSLEPVQYALAPRSMKGLLCLPARKSVFSLLNDPSG